MELNKLKQLRERKEELKEEYKKRLKEFEDENLSLITEINLIKDALFNEETTLRTEAINIFKETGNKDIGNGVKIRILTKLEYDEKTAFDWAKTHQIALCLDKKNFEKIAKTQELEFVNKKEEPQATLPIEIQ